MTETGWSDLIWRRRQRIKATTPDIAASVADAIIQSTNRLRTRLMEEGIGRDTLERFDSSECVLECTLFEWFLHDVLIIMEMGRRAEAVRRALASRVLTDLFRSGLSMDCLSGFDGRWVDRFAEYMEATATGESLQALGGLACRRIFGRTEDSERGAMFLARRASAKLAGPRGFMVPSWVVERGRAVSDQH